MKISLNWLKNYLNINHPVEKISEILTDIGLEVEGIEQFESVKGGLEGVLIGEIKEIVPHPNADRLQLTKVDVGHADLLPIVCGAPNIAVGQKVPVALVGTTLYPDEKGFKIKKSKIRGEVSEGMICAEDELGLGTGHDGVMVLEPEVKVGTLAAEYFETRSDTIFEIGLTPNRIDAASHYGVARDLAAFLNLSEELQLQRPDVEAFKIDAKEYKLNVVVEDAEACPRYSGLVIDQLKVADSPDWLKNNLTAIGVKPINNVVDITNYVLHEIGQPLHAFDLSKVAGNKVIVKKAKEGQKFITLDEKERELSTEDLMICNEQEAMCIAGVLGGADSGVKDSTTAIFLESAYFNAVSIRKTAKRHTLNTDASFRYERGADPNITLYALKRAALLLKEIAGGRISSEIIDLYPEPVENKIVTLQFSELDQLIGQKIDKELVISILENLEFEVLHQDKNALRLSVPAYRVDVTRSVDVIEEVLRIYGYNNIKLPENLRMSIKAKESLSMHKVENTLANFLTSNGFSEIFNNSLTNPDHYEDQSDLVKMLNPLSKETEVMRKSLLFGGLNAVSYNLKRKHERLKFYEFGKVYSKQSAGNYTEKRQLAVWLSANAAEENWQEAQRPVNFFDLKTISERLMKRPGIEKIQYMDFAEGEEHPFASGLKVMKGDMLLLKLGSVAEKYLDHMDLSQEVFYAEFDMDNLLKLISSNKVQYQEVTKFPAMRRDLALLLDKAIHFDQIEQCAKKVDKKLLKKINLFDVYEGKNLPEGKKSYGVSFVFRDNKRTLRDEEVDQIMQKLIGLYQSELKAELR